MGIAATGKEYPTLATAMPTPSVSTAMGTESTGQTALGLSEIQKPQKRPSNFDLYETKGETSLPAYKPPAAAPADELPAPGRVAALRAAAEARGPSVGGPSP